MLTINQVLTFISMSSFLICFDLKVVTACLKKFDNEKDFLEATKTCITKLNLTPESIPKYEDYLNSDFDDKCLGKCVLTTMDLLTETGSLDKDAFFDLIEDHAQKSISNKLTEQLTKCSSSSGIEKVETKDDCKPYGNFQGCFMAASEKLC